MSKDTNQYVVIGRFVQDPELKQTNDGTQYCRFSIASNDDSKNQQGQIKENVNFFDAIVWNKGAEIICDYMKKGNQISLTGKLRQNRWATQTGEKRSKVELVVENFQFIGGKNEAENG
jgi:single-strand DNA-binding protein